MFGFALGNDMCSLKTSATPYESMLVQCPNPSKAQQQEQEQENKHNKKTKDQEDKEEEEDVGGGEEEKKQEQEQQQLLRSDLSLRPTKETNPFKTKTNKLLKHSTSYYFKKK